MVFQLANLVSISWTLQIGPTRHHRVPLTRTKVMAYKILISSLIIQAYIYQGLMGIMEDEIHCTSKTKNKKEAQALQLLGLELSQLSVPQLERIEIPEKLRTALLEGKNITSNIAGRRHRQFIGVLMRDADPESIRLALLQAKTAIPVESEAAKETRVWTDRLLTGDLAEMETLLCEFPGLDRQQLKQLVSNIRKGKKSLKALKTRRALEQLIMTELSSK